MIIFYVSAIYQELMINLIYWDD